MLIYKNLLYFHDYYDLLLFATDCYVFYCWL